MLVLALICISSLFIANAQTFYNAMVIEHFPNSKLETNINYLRDVIDEEKKQKGTLPNLVVFPEYALFGLNSNPSDVAQVVPYDKKNFTGIVKELSDIAAERGLYLIVNLIEKDNASAKYYNTDLVFNKVGDIATRYRKINLNRKHDQGLTPGTDVVTFRTDFGTFGLITGDDILYDYPANAILANSDVTTIIFPNAWKSKAPFYTSLGIQAGYAVAKGITLLSAGLNSPMRGFGGSGIFQGNLIKSQFVSAENGSKSLVANSIQAERFNACRPFRLQMSPFDPPKDISQFKLVKEFNSDDFKSTQLNLQENVEHYENFNDGPFSCSINITLARIAANEMYKMVISKTKQICALLVCQKQDENTCGGFFNSTTLIKKLAVSHKSTNTSSCRPISFFSSLKAISGISFCNSNGTVTYELIETKKEVLAFGLFGAASSGQTLAFSIYLLVLLIVSNIIY